MRAYGTSPDLFNRWVAILYSTVLVLGLVTVIVTVALYFPGVSGSSVSLP